MSTEILDCPEVIGKAVKCLKIYSTVSSLSEIVLEFMDGNYRERGKKPLALRLELPRLSFRSCAAR